MEQELQVNKQLIYRRFDIQPWRASELIIKIIQSLEGFNRVGKIALMVGHIAKRDAVDQHMQPGQQAARDPWVFLCSC